MGGVHASWSHQTLGPEKGLLAPKIHTLRSFGSIGFLPLGNFPPTLCNPMGLYFPWNSPCQSTGVGSHFLLQGIFPTLGTNPGLPHCRKILYQLSLRTLTLLEKQIIQTIQQYADYIWRHTTFQWHSYGWGMKALHIEASSVLFNSVTHTYPTLCNPMDCSTPGLPIQHHLPELTQTHVH